MGYAVLHLEKAKGVDSGMSAHIERTIQPKNANPKRTHLNRELIQFPDGVHNRTAAIQHRLNTAGLTQDRQEPGTGYPHRTHWHPCRYGADRADRQAR